MSSYGLFRGTCDYNHNQPRPPHNLLLFQELQVHSVSYLDGSAKKSIALKKVLNSAE